jgi:predicted outer membrane repeat protein
MFQNCNFTGNTSQHGGAGIMCDQNSEVTVSDCTFQGNSALVGGGLETWWVTGGSVTGCTFTGNTAEHGAGVLYEQSQNMTFTECTFTDNQATGAGGGFDLESATPGPTNCSFSGNSAEYGGAIAIEYCVAPVVTGCAIVGNSAQFGGGIAIDTCDSPVVSGCTIAENTSDLGGGIAIGHCSTPSVVGSTIVLNRADVYGGGIAVAEGTTLSIERTIIGFSQAGEAVASDGCPASCATTAVYGNAGGDWTGVIAGQQSSNNNIAADPLLCGVLSGDYTLCEDSPCLPANNGASVLIGAHGEGCAGPCGAAVEVRSWGGIKAMYR